jgi:hypothetical protein
MKQFKVFLLVLLACAVSYGIGSTARTLLIDTITSSVTNGNITLAPNGTGVTAITGNALVGDVNGDYSHTIGGVTVDSALEVHTSGGASLGGLSTHRLINSATLGAHMLNYKGRGTTGSEAVVLDDDVISRWVAAAFDGTDYEIAAEIRTYVDGTPADDTTDMPGRLSFYTTPDGANAASERMRIDNAGNVGINQTAATHTLDIVGDFKLTHTSTENDDHGLEIILDSAGYSDVKALDVVYTTGALAATEEDAVMLIQIDESLATGGEIFGLEILSDTIGSATVYGMGVGAGIGPIRQGSGTFGTIDTAFTYDDSGASFATVTSDFNSAVSDVTIFAEDNDVVYIGAAAVFEEVTFDLATVASGSGISPTFEFSLGGSSWQTFSPLDGTNGFRNTGEIIWDDADVPSWATDTVNSVSSKYWIRITRTRNSLSTAPIENLVEAAALTYYSWDKDGLITVPNVDITAAGSLKLYENGANYTAFKAPASLTGDVTFTLPDGDGATGQTMVTDGAGTLSWGSSGGGGGGSLELYSTGSGPEEKVQASFLTLEYLDGGQTQSVYFEYRVPSSYTAGNQIQLQAKFFSPATSGTILIESVTNLWEDGDITSGDSHASTNSAVTQDVANEIEDVVMDLTDGSGAINSNSVAPGDLLRVQVRRDVATDTAASAGYLIKSSLEVILE